MLRLKLSHVSKRGPRSLSPDFDHLTQEKRIDLTYVMLLFYHIILSIMSITITTMASLITSLTVVYSTIYSGADQRKHKSSASLAFVRGIHRGPVNSPHKWPVTRKMFLMTSSCHTIIILNEIRMYLGQTIEYLLSTFSHLCYETYTCSYQFEIG